MDNSIKMDLFTVLLLIRVMLRNIFNESLYFTNFASLSLSSPNAIGKQRSHQHVQQSQIYRPPLT